MRRFTETKLATPRYQGCKGNDDSSEEASDPEDFGAEPGSEGDCSSDDGNNLDLASLEPKALKETLIAEVIVLPQF